MPFAGYAQVLRMLMPPVHRVGFYDPKGRALWVNDGIEEPEFRMHLDLVLARFAASRPDERPGPYGATDQLEPFFVFPIRDSRQALLGALTLICRELPATAAYRRIEHVEHLLAPFIEILCHAWQEATNIPQTMPEQKPASPTAPSETSDSTTPLPALLRRTLALATRSLQGAFGTVIAAERPFTLNHRVSPDESDLAINAAIDNVRGTILKYLQARQEPILSNAAGSGRTQQLPYKLLAMPLKADPGTLAAALIVFREKNAPDFSKNDLASMAQLAAQIPAATLKELVSRTKPSIANVPELVAQVEDTATENSTAPLDSAPRAYKPQAVPTVKSPPVLQPEPTRSAPQPPKVVRFAGMRSDMPMDERIRIALRQDAFDLYVQKIAPLRDTQRAERYEVLLRMNDGNTLYTPQAFFAAAEASELMPELDQWVIRELMSTLRKRAAVLRTTCWEFSVNVAAQTLLTDQFSEYVLQELKRSSIPAGLLVFEVAESDAIEHQYSLSILAQRLHGVGCRIALDNCRAGLRTFDTVRKWPVSCLKIDGSLIRHVVSNCRYESQVRAVAKMANEMGIETVAECVETENTRERLLSMEIDYAQGYHFGRPEPLASLFAR
jgi:EAL domain-containing protein (putative c-di-GMP-specific phosphodiesterase class I)